MPLEPKSGLRQIYSFRCRIFEQIPQFPIFPMTFFGLMFILHQSGLLPIPDQMNRPTVPLGFLIPEASFVRSGVGVDDTNWVSSYFLQCSHWGDALIPIKF